MKYNPFEAPIPFHNLSSTQLDQITTAALSHGCKYAYPETKLNVFEILSKAENIILKTPISQQEANRFAVARNLKFLIENKKGNRNAGDPLKNKKNKKELQALKQLKNEGSVKIALADKSPTFVIMDQTDFEEQVFKEIDELQCSEIKKDPTAKHINMLRQLKNHSHLPSMLKKSCSPPVGYAPPYVFPKVKMHKKYEKTPPFRMIVAKSSAPTIKLEKALAKFLRPFLNNTFNVSSTIEALERIKKVQVNKRTKMCSYDVTALYPSLPIDEAIRIIKTKLENSKMFENIEIQDIIIALNFVLKNTYFRYKNKFYLQKSGAPMGSPISGVVAEFVLQELEEEIIKPLVEKGQIAWIRYVDDVCCLGNDENHLFDRIQNKINRKYQEIQFTMEKEIENVLPFLDIRILRQENNFNFTIYRKKTFRPTPIPFSSATPLKYKLSMFQAYLYRAFKICSDIELLKEEIQYIYSIAQEAGYPKKLIDRLFYKIKRNEMGNPEPHHKKNIKYIGSVPENAQEALEPLKKSLQRNNMKFTIRKSSNICNIIQNCKEKPTKMERAGVYTIPVNIGNNTKEYIGSTIRPFSSRIKEHKADQKFNRMSTALSRLNQTHNVEVNWEGAEIIESGNNESDIRFKEALHIYCKKDNVLNDNIPVNLSYAWKWLLEFNEKNKCTPPPLPTPATST